MPERDATTAEIMRLLAPVIGYEFPIAEEQAARVRDDHTLLNVDSLLTWLDGVLERTPAGEDVTLNRAQMMVIAAAMERASHIEYLLDGMERIADAARGALIGKSDSTSIVYGDLPEIAEQAVGTLGQLGAHVAPSSKGLVHAFITKGDDTKPLIWAFVSELDAETSRSQHLRNGFAVTKSAQVADMALAEWAGMQDLIQQPFERECDGETDYVYVQRCDGGEYSMALWKTDEQAEAGRIECGRSGQPTTEVIAIPHLTVEQTDCVEELIQATLDFEIRERDVPGCSCGMADLGAPGHEGHPDFDGDHNEGGN